LDFGNKLDENGSPTPQTAVSLGLTRLNADVRKIPLNWFSYTGDKASQTGEDPTDSQLGTLSWVAASEVDEQLQQEAQLTKMRAASQHPFTSFIDPDNELLRVN